MAHYYNEFDPTAAEWLRELIRAGLIPNGEVDERDIRQVQATDLRGFTQCHFFAGVGGWVEALRLAGWDDTSPVWTGSCPCPPFSSAGKKKCCPECGGKRPVPCPQRTGHFLCVGCGHAWLADERHLWPEFWRLIAECRPPVVFGEQVAGADGLVWLAGVRLSLEVVGYRVGAADLCAAGAGEEAEGRVCRGDSEETERITLGPPHIRQRLFWVANTDGAEWRKDCGRDTDGGGQRRKTTVGTSRSGCSISGVGLADGIGRVADSHSRGSGSQLQGQPRQEPHPNRTGEGVGGLGVPDGGRRGEGDAVPRHPSAGVGLPVPLGQLDDTTGDGRQQGCGVGHGDHPPQSCGGSGEFGGTGGQSRVVGDSHDARPQGRGVSGRERAGERPVGAAGGAGFWSDFGLVYCRDNKVRRIPQGCTEPAVLGVADGLPGGVGGGGPAGGGHGQGSFPLTAEKVEGRVGLLRGYGNAIVPQIAAEFVTAYMEVEREHSGKLPG